MDGCIFDREEPLWDPSHLKGRVLCAGIGGGADCITAWALASWLGQRASAECVYANTKPAGNALDGLQEVASGIYRPTAPLDPGESCFLDSVLPCGPQGSPLVLACPRRRDPDSLARRTRAGIEALQPDLILAVDTGGDVLDGSRRSRDRRMLELLRSCRAPVTLAVVAPGADGQNQARDLAAWSQDTGRFRGVVRLAELAPWLEQMAPHLERYERRKGRASTVTIIIRSLREGEPEVRVPREQEPLIPRAWLTRAFLYELERA